MSAVECTKHMIQQIRTSLPSTTTYPACCRLLPALGLPCRCCSIGGARVLFAGVALWSLGTLIAPPAAKMGLVALCATRLFVGLGEGLAPSSATNVMARLVPE